MLNSRVLIVGKTLAGNGHCLGGLTPKGEALRLLPPDHRFWDMYNNYCII
ncbi:MAG: hypothetical protein P9L92_06025 [Candidatus Electryonea clarkiae]|nr:hypothetical protein [Candidatus Electryonea clarkiae]